MPTPERPSTPQSDLPRARPVSAAPSQSARPLPYATPVALPTYEAGGLSAISQPKASVLVDLLLVFGLFVIASLFVPAFVSGLDASGAAADGGPLDVAVMLTTGFGFAGLAVFIVWLRRQPMATIGAASQNVALDLAIGAGACVAALILVTAIRLFLALMDPAFFRAIHDSTRKIQEAIPPVSIPGAVVIAACVGLYEEVLFRGFALPRLRRLLGSWPATILAASAFFALLHGYQGLAGVATVFVLSVVFSVVFVWRQSLVPVVFAHFLVDFAGLSMLHLIEELDVEATDTAPAWNLWR